MDQLSAKSRLILALEAIQKDNNLSIRRAAKIYNVAATTIRDRRAGKPARRDIPANSRKLTDLEEKAIVEHVVELSRRSFPPRLRGVEDMANQLRHARTGHLSASSGLPTSSSASQSYVLVFLADMTTRGLNGKIRKLFLNGSPLYRI
jgi:hypothetical protein